MAHAQPPAGLEGADLSEVMRGRGEAPDRPIYCDALTPRWGPGTEFRMIRWRRWKYVHFRDCRPLAFDLEADPGEQRNLLKRPHDAETAEALRTLGKLARESIDFGRAEWERTVRDGSLRSDYAQDATYAYGNMYRMPSGRIVGADDVLYEPITVDEDGHALFGSGWQDQNGVTGDKIM